MILVHEQDVTEKYFSHKVKIVQAKMDWYLNSPRIIASFLCKAANT